VSFPTVEHIATAPGLGQWLIGRSWERGIDRGSLQRGRSNATGRRVRRISLEINDIFAFVDGEVQGTDASPYEVEIDLTLDETDCWGLQIATCSCPVGSRCKHTVAILEQLTKIVEAAHAPRKNLPSPAAPISIDSSTAQWIRSIDEALGQTTNPKKKANAGFLAYCLEPHPGNVNRPSYGLYLRKAKHLKSGELRIEVGEATADPMRPAQYMQEGDIDLAARIHRIRRSTPSSKHALKAFRLEGGTRRPGEFRAKPAPLPLATPARRDVTLHLKAGTPHVGRGWPLTRRHWV